MTHLKRLLVRLPIAVVALALTIASALVSALPSHAVVVAPSREALKARALYYFATAQSAERSVMIGTLSTRSAFEGRLWSDFVSTWARINASMTMNTAVPSGLPKKGHVFIVLGSGLKSSGAVSAKFERRLRLAAKAAKAYPAATVLISGGAARRGRTEAEAGYRWLRKAGVKASRLLRESRSSSTIGNAKYSMELLSRDSGYTSYSLISDSSHLRRASVLFEAAEVLVQERTGRSWGIKRLANLAHIDMARAGHGQLRASSVKIAAENVASLFSVLSQYRALVAKKPAKLTFTALQVTPPSTLSYHVGQKVNTEGLVTRAVFNKGTYSQPVSAKVTGFDTATVGTRRATVSYTYRGVTRTGRCDYRVTKAASVTTAKPSAATATRSRTRVTLTATVKSQVAGVTPKGSVRFYLDGVRVGDVVLGSARQGVAALRYPTIATAGSHRLTARYRGDARVTASYESVIIIVKG